MMDSTQPIRIDEIMRSFVETSQDLMTVVDAEARFLFVSPASREVFGLPPEGCVGRLAWAFVHPDDVERTRREFSQWISSGSEASFRFENRQVDQAGTVRHLRWTVTRWKQDEGLVYLTSYARDISAEHRLASELRTSRAHFEAVLNGMLDPVVTISGEGTILSINRSGAAAFGWESDELLGKNVSVLMPEPYRSQHDGYLTRYRETGETSILGRLREFPAQRKDGTPFMIELSVSRIDVPGEGEPVFCASLRDISARKETERELAERERIFRAIFDGEFQFVGLLDAAGHLREVNRTALSSIGATRQDLLGRPFWDTPWWSHSEAERQQVRKDVARAATGEFVRREVEVRGPGSEVRVLDFSIKPICNEDGQVVMLIPEGRDITRLKRAQSRETAMMRAFAEIGESASLLAHEIKNPITSVNLALRAVAKQLGQDEREILTDLVGRMQKLERLMRRTLSLTRPLELELEKVHPRKLLRDAVSSMKPHIEDRAIKIELCTEDDCSEANCDPQLFDDVLINLIRNAVDVLEQGGQIQLGARNADSDVLLWVEDNGPGIPDSVLATVFKPFVSTKCNGTGLGLAIARKVVEAHGGTIEVRQSSLGGARFEIRLPRAN